VTGKPSLRLERQLMRAGCELVAGVDEVGRGAIAGPVSVGVVIVSQRSRTAPEGLRDSKLLTPAARARLDPRIRGWAVAHAVGHATCYEIDEWGLIAALRLAGLRALARCPTPDVVILDGSHDWLSAPGATLFELVPWPEVVVPSVRLRIKADMTCTSVAAASVVAKVERDTIMTGLHGDDDRYAWDLNKGYTTLEHAGGIRTHGLSRHHRRSWDIAAAIDLRTDLPHDPRNDSVDVPVVHSHDEDVLIPS
jgi:ribonuclease HII